MRSELVLRQDLRVVLCRSVQRVEDDDAFCRLIYQFTVNKILLKYQIRTVKTRTNSERHDETKKGEGVVRYNKSKPDDFRAKYEHMMGGSGLIELQILKGLEAEGHPGLRAVLGSLRGPPPIRGHAKDIATQMAGICTWLQ